jgi:enhancer of polycomb-like protein
VDLADAEAYNKIYPLDYKLPRQLIHMQRKLNFLNCDDSVEIAHVECWQFVFFLSAFAMEQDIPDYDMDSEDEKWVHSQAKKMDLLPLKVL